MGEIPSFRANPLEPKCDEWCEFPVKDRANAVQQWIDAAERYPSMIKVRGAAAAGFSTRAID